MVRKPVCCSRAGWMHGLPWSLDLDAGGDFPWQVFDHLFGKLGAKSISFSSASRDVGNQYRAVFLGSRFGSACCEWNLERDQYLRAERPARTEERVEVPRPLN